MWFQRDISGKKNIWDEYHDDDDDDDYDDDSRWSMVDEQLVQLLELATQETARDSRGDSSGLIGEKGFPVWMAPVDHHHRF